LSFAKKALRKGEMAAKDGRGCANPANPQERRCKRQGAAVEWPRGRNLSSRWTGTVMIRALRRIERRNSG
jgi:hypothetical protein